MAQLGLPALILYALHQIRKRSVWLRWRTPPGGHPALPAQLTLATELIPIPELERIKTCLGQEGVVQLIAEADEILQGQVRLYGGFPVPLQLKIAFPLQHWTAYEHGIPSAVTAQDAIPQDIKDIWEPGRFGWAIVLARAFYLTGNNGYAQFFWNQLETFLASNPPNLGPHWASAQEVALRLIAFVFADEIFQDAPASTPERRVLLAQAIADHASRIPPSLDYARAQHNNHLISEALGLYTAGLALPDHPRAESWRQTGWCWLNHALQTQIAPTGAYAQHSTNYHRLVLQAALWADRLARTRQQKWEDKTLNRLTAATRWLLSLCDPVSGEVPNLGPNDGAWIFPLATCPFRDYRPTLNAAALAFLATSPFSAGLWDETAIWLGLGKNSVPLPPVPSECEVSEPHCLQSPDGNSWAYLRLARFSSRPGHADQLHLDLWWRGLNLAIDPGTYRYNAPEPWENALTHTAVHNTLTINGLDQMTRAGRFLYLDWAQAHLVYKAYASDGKLTTLVGEHDGYRKSGLRHRRSVECNPLRWIITDQVIPIHKAASNKPVSVRLHWLLPDLPWDIEAHEHVVVLRVHLEFGCVTLTIRCSAAVLEPWLVRAGETLLGCHPAQPTWGWTAPTYGYKIPSLSFSVVINAEAPLELTSIWDLPSV